MSIKVQGWDLSLDHSGFVEFIDGELSNFWYITTVVGSANRSKKHGYRLVLPKTKETKDRQMKFVFRLAQIRNFIRDVVLASKPDYVAIEDYSMRSKGKQYNIGEAGGVARLLCLDSGIRFRLHDPLSVKMFVTHDGSCQKDLVEKKVLGRWDEDFSKYNPPQMKNKNENRTTSEDLSDAYGLAKMCWTEVLLRNGKLLMKDLHEKEVRVFNRITKSYPVSLLDREWIYCGDEFPVSSNVKMTIKHIRRYFV